MSTEDAYKLNNAQVKYEEDPSNPQRAYDYFLQLNKHHFYLNVVRDYQSFKRQLASFPSRNSEANKQWIERVQYQYEYAKDHLKQMVNND